MKDYIAICNDRSFIETNNSNKYDYVLLMSCTKFITLVAFLNCIKNHNIKITDKISTVIPEYKHKYKFIDIINHNTKIQNDWFYYDDEKHKYIPSNLQKQYLKSEDIYKFTIDLLIDKTKKDKFNYNNYNYNILAYTIYKLCNKNIDEHLKETILKNVKFKWMKINEKILASEGLFIRTSSMKKLATQLLQYIHDIDLDFFWSSVKLSNNIKLIGHDGTGGQYIYYNKKKRSIMFWFYYGLPNKNNKKRQIEDFIRIYKKYDNMIG